MISFKPNAAWGISFMKLSDFIKDKLYLILSAALTFVTMFLFLQAVHCNKQVIITVALLFWAFVFIMLTVEYLRRRVFYQNAYTILNDLDQKYLLTEIVEEPQFIDGVIFYDVMQEINKDMLEHVNEYKYREEDYRNYIEMWVHEIKTPLAAARLIIDNHDNEVTQSIAEELDKVENLVEQTLYYARSTTLEKDYIIKEMPLQPSVHKVIRRHAKEFIYRNIKVETQGLSETVYSDAKWLEFILNQIISNALKYSESGGKIRIETKKCEDSLILSIQDEGIGISLNDLPRIFDKGFTGHNGRNNEKATGMGLYLCKLLCDKLYLSISASSNEGQGTTIRITFPINAMLLLK